MGRRLLGGCVVRGVIKVGRQSRQAGRLLLGGSQTCQREEAPKAGAAVDIEAVDVAVNWRDDGWAVKAPPVDKILLLPPDAALVDQD